MSDKLTRVAIVSDENVRYALRWWLWKCVRPGERVYHRRNVVTYRRYGCGGRGDVQDDIVAGVRCEC